MENESNILDILYKYIQEKYINKIIYQYTKINFMQILDILFKFNYSDTYVTNNNAEINIILNKIKISFNDTVILYSFCYDSCYEDIFTIEYIIITKNNEIYNSKQYFVTTIYDKNKIDDTFVSIIKKYNISNYNIFNYNISFDVSFEIPSDFNVDNNYNEKEQIILQNTFNEIKNVFPDEIKSIMSYEKKRMIPYFINQNIEINVKEVF
jgi:hypothetical protein